MLKREFFSWAWPAGTHRLKPEKTQRRKLFATLGLRAKPWCQPQGRYLGSGWGEWLLMRYTNEIPEI
jgi:hypothetical protein